MKLLKKEKSPGIDSIAAVRRLLSLLSANNTPNANMVDLSAGPGLVARK